MIRNFRLFPLVILLTGLAYSGMVYADDFPTLDSVLNTFSDNVPNLMRMVTAFAYVMGIWLVVKSVFAMKKFAEQRTMMSSENSLKPVLLYLFAGAVLIWLPTSIDVAMNTLWTTPSPFAYVTDDANPWSVVYRSAFIVLQLIGVIAFIRGMIIMTHLAGQGGQQGTFGKAMAHIIGGVLCINMYDTVRTILYSFGLQDIFS